MLKVSSSLIFRVASAPAPIWYLVNFISPFNIASSPFDLGSI